MSETTHYEKYNYVGKELPDYVPLPKTQELHAKAELYPPRYGVKIGDYTKEGGRRSLFTADKNCTGPTIFDRLIEAGIPEEYSYQAYRTFVEDGKEVEKLVLVTSYYLMYEHENALFRRPTATEPIENSSNVLVDGTVEVHFVVDEMNRWDRYLSIPLKTSAPSITILDILDDLPDIILDWAEESQFGFEFEDPDDNDEDDPIRVAFFNEVGTCDMLNFQNIHDLFRTIVSIRLVDLKNVIVDRRSSHNGSAWDDDDNDDGFDDEDFDDED